MAGILSDWLEIKSTIAPSLFFSPMDWILQHTVHIGLAGASLGDESLSDLDYADDVTLHAKMLVVLFFYFST